MFLSIDDFINYLNTIIPCEWHDYLKARKVYTELGKLIYFDINYTLGNSGEKRKIYGSIINNYKTLNKLFIQRSLICKSITLIYNYILNSFNISSVEMKDYEDDEHVYSYVTISEKFYVVADLQLDLENIQTKSKLKHFNLIYSGDLSDIDQIYFDDLKVDYKINYLESSDHYFDINLDKIQDVLDSSLTTEVKICKFLNYLLSYNEICELNFIELIRYTKYSISSVLNYIEMRKVYFGICNEIVNDNKYYIFVITVGDYAFWYRQSSKLFIYIEPIKLLNILKTDQIKILQGELFLFKRKIVRTSDLTEFCILK